MTERPSIVVNVDRAELLAKARKALIETKDEPPRTFIHGAVLVRIGQDDKKRPLIRVLDRAGVRALLASKIEWLYDGAKGTSPADPPSLVIDDLTSNADKLIELEMPVLDQVVHAPIFAPDGTLVTAPGYAAAARVWYEPVDGMVIPEVPERPTQEMLTAAVHLIRDELLGEFPFIDDADLTHAVALLILLAIRPMIDGPTPLHLIDAPTAGTGKTLLSDVVMIVGLGDVPPLTAEVADNDEMRKQLTTIFLAGYPTVLFDNVQRRVDSSALSAALTARVWRQRILGVNRDANVPVTQVFVMTGNNVDLTPELGRRVATTRLDVTKKTIDPDIAEHPWRRTIIREQPLREWTREHRGELVHAVLVLVRSWIVDGRIPWSGRPLGSFESWSKTVGGILEHAGFKGFLANLEDVYDESVTEREERCAYIEAWWQTYGESLVSTNQLDALTLQPDVPDIFGLLGSSAAARSMRIGQELKRMRDTTWCGRRIKKQGRRYHLIALGGLQPTTVLPLDDDDEL
jgi:putative DNA primase/helicase